jgi:hypothetical protein
MRRMAAMVWMCAATVVGTPGAAAECASLVSPDKPPRLTEASVPAAVVTGWEPGVFFIKDRSERAGCPSDAPECQAATAVAPGEAVLLNGLAVGGYACATYSDSEGTLATGWLPLPRLALISSSVPGPQDWEGDWTAPEKAIRIALTAAGDLALDGSATWGAADPEQVMRGSVHVGAFKVRLQPEGAVLGFTRGPDGTLPYDAGEPSDCRMQLARRGPYLVAVDDGACGEAHVTFTGVYRRE